jgi:ATP-dependent DNA helicase RecQ
MEKELHAILKEYWGFQSFRTVQLDIIKSVLNSSDTLALLPTGGGKSLCYQVPAIYKEGTCVVVTPLIALMKDQVSALKKRNVAAAALYSGISYAEIESVISECVNGHIKLLYLSPERLLSEKIMNVIAQMNISFFAVDEAHCISEWGYDFRPSYLQISQVRQLHSGCPVLALTATATKDVQKDIISKLNFKNQKIFSVSFKRPNINFLVYNTEDRDRKVLDVIKGVKGSALIYVRNRKRTREISEMLVKNKHSADFYHAGLPVQLRNSKQDDWLKNQIRVMVCTNAFGMGIDKPDVRTVVHMGLPDSLEAYYQEAGRAGRDSKVSYAVLLYDQSDIDSLIEKTSVKYPEIDVIRNIYNTLCNYLDVPVGSGMATSYDFDITAFSSHFNLNPHLVSSVIRILSNEGFLQLNDAWFIPSKLKIIVSPEELYNYRVGNAIVDPVVKVILRTSEGVFFDFVPYNDNKIAGLVKSNTPAVRKIVKKLVNEGILEVTPLKDQPQLIFLSPREDSKYIEIDTVALEKRRENYKKRIEAIIHYAVSKEKCRMVMMLSYLGETPDARCGTCDYCRTINKIGINDIKLKEIQESVIKQITSGPVSVKNLVSAITIDPVVKDDVINVLRWMADNNQITIDGEVVHTYHI